jgi:hypothetical protein
MIRCGKWLLASAILAGAFLFSLPGGACTTTLGGKSVAVGPLGVFVCDCSGDAGGCGCVIEAPCTKENLPSN